MVTIQNELMVVDSACSLVVLSLHQYASNLPVLCLVSFLEGGGKKTSRKPGAKLGLPSSTLPELVAKPTTVRSMPFASSHEYLFFEIIKGEGHGCVVDWWTCGIFLHELLYG